MVVRRVRFRIRKEKKKTLGSGALLDYFYRRIMSYDSGEVEALHAAVFRNRKNEVKAALSSVTASGARSDGSTALHIVASTGSACLCRLLLTASPPLDARESHGATPLSIACQNGHSEVAKLLIGAGADVNLPRLDGVTPLYIAAQEGHVHTVAELLAVGVDVACVRPGSGATALYVAAQKGRAKVLAMLVAAGAEIDVCVDCMTALEASINHHHMKCAQILIESGATVKAKLQNTAVESLVQKKLEKAMLLLAELESAKDGVRIKTSSRGKNVVSNEKKRMAEVCIESDKMFDKVDKELALACEALKKERDEAREAITSWKIAFMVSARSEASCSSKGAEIRRT